MRSTISITCHTCTKIFQRGIHHYNFSIKQGKTQFFCSRTCIARYKSKRKSVICNNCGKTFSKKNSQISSTNHNFCDSSCFAKFVNKQKRKSKRSKIEIKLYELLREEFPDLIILPNDKTMLNGLEVDIAIPDLKLAIEWNGVVHFKPIYGEEKLQKIKSKDEEKLKLATQKNINLIIISDLVSTKKFLDRSFLEIKSIISELL